VRDSDFTAHGYAKAVGTLRSLEAQVQRTAEGGAARASARVGELERRLAGRDAAAKALPAMGGEVIITHPCAFFIENPSRGIQGGAQMS
jgi:hypothetical protein